MPLRATRGFITHLDGVSRRFAKDEIIPEDWAGTINARSLVDGELDHLDEPEPGEVDPFPEYRALKTVDDVLSWVNAAAAFDDRVTRARYAQADEENGRGRKTLIEGTQELIATATEFE